MSAVRVVQSQDPVTDVAVLQVQVQNIEDRVDEIKQDLKDMNSSSIKRTEDTHAILKEMKEGSHLAHKSMSDKILSLEKWRWMMMGAGVVIGSLGFDTIAKFLK
jgi:hypothetical protein